MYSVFRSCWERGCNNHVQEPFQTACSDHTLACLRRQSVRAQRENGAMCTVTMLKIIVNKMAVPTSTYLGRKTGEYKCAQADLHVPLGLKIVEAYTVGEFLDERNRSVDNNDHNSCVDERSQK